MHPHQKKLDSLLIRLIVNASLPLYLVDHSDLRAFIKCLNPQYQLPSKKRLVYSLLPDLYNNCLKMVKKDLNDVSTTAVTCDAWTDPRMKAFFGITAHTIDSNWIARSYLLGCNRIHGHHTAPNIFNSYEAATNKFEINHKITHNITDNAANMVCAFKKISFMSKKVVNGILHDK